MGKIWHFLALLTAARRKLKAPFSFRRIAAQVVR
jgi:hypothetical protein